MFRLIICSALLLTFVEPFPNSRFFNLFDSINLLRNVYRLERFLTSEDSVLRSSSSNRGNTLLGEVFYQISLLAESETLMKDYLLTALEAKRELACLKRHEFLNLQNSIRPIIDSCAKESRKRSKVLLKTVQSDMEGMTSAVEPLQNVAYKCYQEPGVGEKINCVIQHVSQKLIWTWVFFSRLATVDFVRLRGRGRGGSDPLESRVFLKNDDFWLSWVGTIKGQKIPKIFLNMQDE